jgi:hypothetical protein
MGKRRDGYLVWCVSLREGHLDDPGIDGKIILKWILEK